MANKKQSNRVIVLKYVGEVNDHDELDLLLLEDHFPGYSDDNHMNNYPKVVREIPEKYYWAGEQCILKISELEKSIEKLKDLQATHVEIVYHSDHHGYNIYGVHAYNASKEKMDEIYSKESKALNEYLKEKKQELLKEIAKIDKELSK